MNEKEKRDLLRKVPTRKLVASIKKDLKRQMRAGVPSRKPLSK